MLRDASRVVNARHAAAPAVILKPTVLEVNLNRDARLHI